eukprot:151325-Chlamydomonas_euryale.AAC.24
MAGDGRGGKGDVMDGSGRRAGKVIGGIGGEGGVGCAAAWCDLPSHPAEHVFVGLRRHRQRAAAEGGLFQDQSTLAACECSVSVPAGPRGREASRARVAEVWRTSHRQIGRQACGRSPCSRMPMALAHSAKRRCVSCPSLCVAASAALSPASLPLLPPLHARQSSQASGHPLLTALPTALWCSCAARGSGVAASRRCPWSCAARLRAGAQTGTRRHETARFFAASAGAGALEATKANDT